jgi:hypothetical protein
VRVVLRIGVACRCADSLRINGTTANQVSWMTGGTSAPDLAAAALLGHNDWLENILADQSDLPYATKVILNKPEYLKDSCWFNGVKYEEPLSLDPSAKCNQLMPVFGTVRLAAGGILIEAGIVQADGSFAGLR